MNKRMAYFLLSSVPLFSHEKLEVLMDYYGGPEALSEVRGERLSDSGAVFTFTEITQWDAMRDRGVLEEKYEMMEKQGIRFITKEDTDFPKRLLSLPDCPYGLFLKGRLIPEDAPSAGIVGARRCTQYGKESAHFFGKMLAAAGVSIVSGMALGVDGMAGRGALAGNGRTLAVLGSGADVCYPAENIDLYEELSRNGGILTERPPGYEARPYDFPIRNRLISGLSDVLIVIEAAENSGSMITVNHALSQGKDVFALPGRVGDRMSAGSNELIKNGAQVLTCPEDVLQYFGMDVKSETVRRNRVTLTREEKIILDYLGGTPRSMDDLLALSGFPVSILAGILVDLEIKGAVKKTGMSGYIRLL
ncbi:MAG: DNA-processing protein DprA [Lachnospiraceae bacterium]|nr:DNA-processing protein DprA [Lachnospiraceae bacterium]